MVKLKSCFSRQRFPIEFKKFENTDFVVQVNEEVDVSERTFAALVAPGIELNVVSFCLPFFDYKIIAQLEEYTHTFGGWMMIFSCLPRSTFQQIP